MQGAFRETLESELVARRSKNARYSLRAFARFLNADHSSVAQILRGSRPIPAVCVRAWARKLGFGAEEAAVYVAAERVESSRDSERSRQLRHWTAEALAVINEPAHFELLKLSHKPGFVSDTRWVANHVGVSTDEVNIALTRLLRLGLVEAGKSGIWQDVSALQPLTREGFSKEALSRIRAFAAADGVKQQREGVTHE